MNWMDEAKWIKPSADYGEACPVFRRDFAPEKTVERAALYISALGVYEATLNGQRIGDFILAPGWTAYQKRLQFQQYDITSLLQGENRLDILLGKGWCAGRITWLTSPRYSYENSVICAVELTYTDGTQAYIYSDEAFQTAQSPILFSEIYDGETYDARITPENWTAAQACDMPKDILIPQEGERVVETQRLKPVALIHTPAGETVIDFGQNLTGYVEFQPAGNSGDVLELSHAEVLDRDGNFYTENLRSAKQKITYICNGHDALYKPHFTFQGFRYIRLDKWSGNVNLDAFTAVVVHSNLKRTGWFECSNPKLNRLYQNIIWGQRGNFLDVPTDCPQRDERLGWTGDAQVFVRAASYNYDVERFFHKWLGDLAADQTADGGVPAVIPNVLGSDMTSSSAWGDAAVICPWQIYLTYGNKDFLATHFDSMKKWVDYIHAQGDSEFLWNTGHHFGDWLALDNEPGSNDGKTDKHLIATAYFAYSTQLLIKAGTVLGKDMADYRQLYENVADTFRKTYMRGGQLTSDTQTAYALALYFGLSKQPEETAKTLADLVAANGNKLNTGFVGTPYLLYALSQNGYEELAYTLLLQEEFPSWLYSVNRGATTIWEHWDGINEEGEMWSAGMNSFNHYAYGAVADWMYGVLCGIQTDEEAPGFARIRFRPKFDGRLDFARASIQTRHGTVSARWTKVGDQFEYTVCVPEGCSATLELGGAQEEVGPGEHSRIV